MNDFKIEPDMKGRIEKLLIWFIPVFLISVIATFMAGKATQLIANTMLISPGEHKGGITNYMIAFELLRGLDNLVVSIWLFSQAKYFKFNRLLWPMFGLIQPFFAVVILLFTLVIQGKHRISSNPASYADY